MVNHVKRALIAASMIGVSVPAVAATPADNAVYISLLAYIQTQLSVAGAEMSAFTALGLDPNSSAGKALTAAFAAQSAAQLKLVSALQNAVSPA